MPAGAFLTVYLTGGRPPPEKMAPTPKPDRLTPVSAGGFVITPDTPLDEL